MMSDNIDWLYDDVKQNREALEQGDSQLARRNYLRSLAAFYDVVLSNLRETTAKLLTDEFDTGGEWRLHELYPLLDETARLSGNGKLELDANRLPFLALTAYTLKTYAKQLDLARDVLSDSRWQDFCQSVKIRHRVTHPKFHSEIDITDDELRSIDAGWAWWNDILRELGEAHRKKMVG
jgi:hypothetical protein